DRPAGDEGGGAHLHRAWRAGGDRGHSQCAREGLRDRGFQGGHPVLHRTSRSPFPGSLSTTTSWSAAAGSRRGSKSGSGRRSSVDRRNPGAGVNGSEAASGRPEVRRLPLVESRRGPLHGPRVDVAAQVELQDLCRAIRADGPFPGAHDFLRDIVAGEDVLPGTLRELVTAIGGAASESGRGLEEELLSPAP